MKTHIHATTISIALGSPSTTLLPTFDGFKGVEIIFSALPLTKATRPKIDFQFSAIHPAFQDEGPPMTVLPLVAAVTVPALELSTPLDSVCPDVEEEVDAPNAAE